MQLYVQRARRPNAYAAGRRSVAVTSRVLEDHRTGRLPEGQLVAVLVHELGHHATGATRPMLGLTWLTAPWRATATVLAGLANILAGRHPRQQLSIVVLAGLVVAAIRALQQGQWMAAGVLLVAGLTAVLVPLANAAISRRSEYAADRFAADHGPRDRPGRRTARTERRPPSALWVVAAAVLTAHRRAADQSAADGEYRSRADEGM